MSEPAVDTNVTVRTTDATAPTVKVQSALLWMPIVALPYVLMCCLGLALEDPRTAAQVLAVTAAVLAVTAAWHVMTSRQYVATSQGLLVRRPLRRPRLIPYAEITGVSVGAGSVQIALQRGRTISFVAGRAELALADHLDADLWRAEHGTERQLMAEEHLVELIGLSSAEHVDCTPAGWARGLASPEVMLSLVVTGALLGGFTYFIWPWLALTGLLPAAAAVYGGLLAWTDGAGMELSADLQGLHLPYGRSGRLCPWSHVRDVAEVKPRPRLFGGHRRWRLTLTNGTLPLSSLHTQVERLVALCQRAAELRQQGHAWPAAVEIPDGALSRATGDDADAERGLSQTDG